jgi:hypothetical protein
MTFVKELTILLNKYSRDNDANTPDYIMSEYLTKCLIAFTQAVRDRDEWFKPIARKPNPRRNPPAVIPKRRKINEGDVKPRRPIRGKP